MKNNSGSYYGSWGICLTLWSNSTLCFKSESKLFRKSNQLSCYLFEMHIISISSTNGKQFVPVVVS